MAALGAHRPILPREPEARSRCCGAAPSTTRDIKAVPRRPCPPWHCRP